MRRTKPTLLSDEQMAEFIVNGFLVFNNLQNELPEKFSESIFDQVENLKIQKGTNPGNNILPILPQLNAVFETPTIKGALTSILGEGYSMHSHRFTHLTQNGFQNQNYHKDSYFGYKFHRSHKPRHVMVMYYPQSVTKDMGPTGILPGKKYFGFNSANKKKKSIVTKILANVR